MKSDFHKYKKSGLILADALKYAKEITEPGIKLIDIAEKVENFIRNQSAQPAFPVNISINEIAAHYSPVVNDDSTIPEGSIVKIDAGVSVDGFLTDAARTFIFDDKWTKMKLLAETALENALKAIKPNDSVFIVGEIVEKTIKKEGYKPIVNLSGHSMTQYSLHGGVSIPNYKISREARDDSHRFIPGNVYAIEPFVTTGSGKVFDDKNITIYRHYRDFKKNEVPEEVEEIYLYIKQNFCNLPFSWRWIFNSGFSLKQIERAKEVFLSKHIVHGYPVLVESKFAPVTQAEETIYVSENDIIILTNTE
ncbi:MAG: type II methionyl aminopeptidase [Candidatus Heimdallarchaeota archaeon]|nr:type II methionyl aminopeptidase [Candidatus Heimdallarchaeota archaeon]MCK4875991.1 type II methionyl aminopeptidase [Candidatus Heimdallarchaeota archaeon]